MLIFRRWKVALPLLLITIGGTAFVAFTAKPDYVMTSYVQFIPAKVAPEDNPTAASLRNPWNQLGLFTLGQASIYATQDQGFLDSLEASNHTTNFTLTITYPNPIVTAEVVGKSPADARDTTELVISRLRDSAEALQRQSRVQDADMIATQRLDAGQNLSPSGSKVKRAIFAVAAAGLILTAGGTVGFDALMRRRARKRRERERAELPHEASPGLTSGEVTALSRAPVVHADPAETMVQPRGLTPPDSSAEQPAALAGTSPSASMERTAIVVKRVTPVVKPASSAKSKRPPQTATYRSVNAQNEPTGEDHEVVPSATNGNAKPTSDVRVVLQPKWVGGENGGKPN